MRRQQSVIIIFAKVNVPTNLLRFNVLHADSAELLETLSYSGRGDHICGEQHLFLSHLCLALTCGGWWGGMGQWRVLCVQARAGPNVPADRLNDRSVACSYRMEADAFMAAASASAPCGCTVAASVHLPI